MGNNKLDNKQDWIVSVRFGMVEWERRQARVDWKWRSYLAETRRKPVRLRCQVTGLLQEMTAMFKWQNRANNRRVLYKAYLIVRSLWRANFLFHTPETTGTKEDKARFGRQAPIKRVKWFMSFSSDFQNFCILLLYRKIESYCDWLQ